MIFFLLAPLCFAAFSLIVRQSQRLNLDMLVVGAVNYVFAALVFGLLWGGQGVSAHPQVTPLGLVAGVIYVSGFFVLIATMRDRGVSLAAALMQLSVLIPMVASLLVWHEVLQPMRAAGALLCLVAMPLIVLDKGVTSEPLNWRRVVLFVGMFLMNGLALLCSKVFEVMGLPAQLYQFSALLFGTAGVGGVLVAVLWRCRVTGPGLLWGVLLGLSNAGAVLCLIKSLQHYPGFVVFPVIAALSLAAVVIYAALVWREVPGKTGWVGLGLTVAAAVLANL